MQSGELRWSRFLRQAVKNGLLTQRTIYPETRRRFTDEFKAKVALDELHPVPKTPS